MWNKVIWIKIYHGNRNTICTCNVHRIFYLLVTFFINNIWLYRYFGCLLCGTIQYIKRLLHIILYTYCMLFDVYIHLNENKIINCHFFFLKRRHIVHCVTQITLSFVYRIKNDFLSIHVYNVNWCWICKTVVLSSIYKHVHTLIYMSPSINRKVIFRFYLFCNISRFLINTLKHIVSISVFI